MNSSKTNVELAQLLYAQTKENEDLHTHIHDLQHRLTRTTQLLTDLKVLEDPDGGLSGPNEHRTRSLLVAYEERARVAEGRLRTVQESWRGVLEGVESTQHQTHDTLQSFSRLLQQSAVRFPPPARPAPQQHRPSFPPPQFRPSAPNGQAWPPPEQRKSRGQHDMDVDENTASTSHKRQHSSDGSKLTGRATPQRSGSGGYSEGGKRRKVWTGPEIDLTDAGHASPLSGPSPKHHPIAPQHTVPIAIQSASSSTPTVHVTTAAAPHILSTGESIEAYPSHDSEGRRICRMCGIPGRYKEGKCVEKWGPGPLGAGTVCDRCRKRMRRTERRSTEDQQKEKEMLPRGLVPGQLIGKKHEPHHANTLPSNLPSHPVRPPPPQHMRSDTLPAIALSGSSTKVVERRESMITMAPDLPKSRSPPRAPRSLMKSPQPSMTLDVPPKPSGRLPKPVRSHHLTRSPQPSSTLLFSHSPQPSTTMLSDADADADGEEDVVEVAIMNTLSPLPASAAIGGGMMASPQPTMNLDLPRPNSAMSNGRPSSAMSNHAVMSSPYALSTRGMDEDEDDVFKEAVDAAEGR